MSTQQSNDGDRVNAKLTAFESDSNREEPTFGDDMTPAEFRDACEAYAEWACEEYDTFDPVDMAEVEVEQSQQLERAAGKAGQKKHPITGDVELRMRFAYNAYDEWGWCDDVTGTIRHELVHIVQYVRRGEGGHGFDFKMMADEVDAPRHCKKFTDYNYLLFCTECGDQIGGRLKRSKTVKEPEKYQSKCCSAPLRSEEA